MTGTEVLITGINIVVFLGAVFWTVTYLTLAERRVSAFLQDRYGPNRVGPGGLLQPFADALNFLLKEEIIPTEADRPIYLLAPAMILVPALVTFAVIPFGKPLLLRHEVIPLQIADVNIGILYIFAIASLGVYGIVLGAWSSNSKYPLLGGLRSAAQMLSYEIALGLSVMGVLMMVGSLRLSEVVTYQTTGRWAGFLPRWTIFVQPVAFLVFLAAAFAETNRLPFDLTEAEQELVGGYHTEYSSMKFAMYFMAEYGNMFTASALAVTLFFGGWDFPFVNEEALGLVGVVLSVVAFAMKVGLFLFFYLWVRWTLPRFRYDQLMRIGWKVLVPVGLANLVVTGLILPLFA